MASVNNFGFGGNVPINNFFTPQGAFTPASVGQASPLAFNGQQLMEALQGIIQAM